MAPNGLLTLLLATPSLGSILWATSYNDHTVTSLNLNAKEGNLTVLSKSLDCGSEPTWLTLDYGKSILYCLNEGWGGNASMTSYKTSQDGSLETLDELSLLKSPVSSALYGPNKTGLAVAYYDTSSFASFTVADPSSISILQSKTYTMSVAGPVADRQDAPHLHNTVLDPTGKFILVPDLGADRVHVYSITPNSVAWTELDPVTAVPGSGPRHGAFAVSGKNTFFYTVNELSNTITGYKVAYTANSSLAFTQLFDVSTHGPNGTVPAGTKAAEIHVSPDQKFVLISSRGENSLTIPNFDPTNSTAIPSDPIVSFSIDGRSGALSLLQVTSIGGRDPRGFNINKAGTLVAAALQDDNRVVVIERDVKTGKLGSFVGWATVGEGDGNGPNYVVFNE